MPRVRLRHHGVGRLLADAGPTLLVLTAASQLVLLLCAIKAVLCPPKDSCSTMPSILHSHLIKRGLVAVGPDDVDLDGTGVPSHRVEVRISDPNTQCDKSKPGHKDRSWMTGMQHERNYLGLLDFGQMEAQGFLDIAGYQFVYQDHAVVFTDEFSTACEPPVLVFFDSANEIVDTVDPRGLSMTSIVKELAIRGIKSHVRSAPEYGSSDHLQEQFDNRHTKQPPGIRTRQVGTERLKTGASQREDL